jgi:hypothetical protein
MKINIGGQIIYASPSGRPNACRLIQIVDGDLGGNVPMSLLSMLSTKTFPASMNKLNNLLKTLPLKTISSVVNEAAGIKTHDTATSPGQEATTSTSSSPLGAVIVRPKNSDMSITKIFTLFQTVTGKLKTVQPWLVTIIFVTFVVKNYKK